VAFPSSSNARLSDLSYELELLTLATLLYLYDSTVLLHANEAILSCDRRNVWRASTGLDGIMIAGRRLCFLNPFTMYRPCARLVWNMYSPDQPVADKSWTEDIGKLRPLAPWTVIAGVALFLLLPLGLFTFLGARAVLAAVIALYGSILTAGLLIWHRHLVPGLEGLRLAGFLFECLACPPFGVNVLRRASLRNQVREPLLFAANRLLSATEWHALRARCIDTLEMELGGLAGPSPERQSLEDRVAQLRAWTGPK
jgi:hypothetical protein